MDFESLLGREVGGFRLVELLGHGGMASVYRGENLLDATIVRAIKIVHSQFANNEIFAKRFAEEARNLERLRALRHPNLLEFYGVRRDGEHLLMELELLDGEDLFQKLATYAERGAIVPVKTAANWVLQAARGVAAAHGLQDEFGKSIVHRDLKPGNFIVTPQGTLKVLDFGLARAVDDADRQARLTVGKGPGTPEYMAPEVCRDQPFTPAADVYALGLTLYELLLGHHPFQTMAGEAKSYAAMVLEQVTTELPPIKARRADVPEALGKVVAKATEKDPKARHRDASELVLALESYEAPAQVFHKPETSFGVAAEPRPEPKPKPTVKPKPVDPPRLWSWRKFAMGATVSVVVGIVAVFLVFQLSKESPFEDLEQANTTFAQEKERAIQAEVALRLEAARDEAAKLAEEQAQKEAADKIAAAEAEAAKRAECKRGQVLSKGRCCWEGQHWDEDNKKCKGECPFFTRYVSSKGCVLQESYYSYRELYWKNCPESQYYNGSSCVGDLKKYRWTQLLNRCEDPYRAPTKDELQAVIKDTRTSAKLKKPRLKGTYWSSTTLDYDEEYAFYGIFEKNGFDVTGSINTSYIYDDYVAKVICVRDSVPLLFEAEKQAEEQAQKEAAEATKLAEEQAQKEAAEAAKLAEEQAQKEAAEAAQQAKEEAKRKAAEAAKLAEEQAQKEAADKIAAAEAEAAKKADPPKKEKCQKYHSLIGQECVFQDIQQPGSSLYWRRCAQGQKWTGSRCKGGKIKRTWKKAKRSCPRGYRLPSKSQFEGIFAGKKHKKMFSSDTDWYWSSSPYDGDGAWHATFHNGSVYWVNINGGLNVRCVR